MTAGNHVLVCRVQSIIPIDWRKKSLIFHITLTVLRFMVGMVDVALIHIANYPDGTCEYTDEEFVSSDLWNLKKKNLFFLVGSCIYHIRYTDRPLRYYHDISYIDQSY
jgi:hypothetical protein